MLRRVIKLCFITWLAWHHLVLTGYWPNFCGINEGNSKYKYFMVSISLIYTQSLLKHTLIYSTSATLLSWATFELEIFSFLFFSLLTHTGRKNIHCKCIFEMFATLSVQHQNARTKLTMTPLSRCAEKDKTVFCNSK